MKLPTFLFYFIIALLTIANIFLLISIKKKNEDYNSIYQNYRSNLSILNSRVKKYQTYYTFSLLNENLKTKTDQKVVSLANDTLSFQEIFLAKKTYLIFKYSNLNCNSCIESIFKKLNSVVDSLSNIDIVVLTYQESIRNLISESMFINNGSYKIYLLLENNINAKMDGNDLPELFIIKNGIEIENIFFVDSTDDFINEYFEIIRKKYSQCI